MIRMFNHLHGYKCRITDNNDLHIFKAGTLVTVLHSDGKNKWITSTGQHIDNHNIRKYLKRRLRHR